MKPVGQHTKNAWLSGDYTGTNRPMQRATIQNFNMLLRNAPGQEKYASAVFGQVARPVELPNIKSIRWNRSVDSDTASCTIVLYNTEPLPLGQIPERHYELGFEGYYTYNRGKTAWSQSKWGHTANGWQGRIVPDRIIRTYEGYGFDPTVKPEADPHMYPSGVWIVDEVVYSTDGLITVQCRDLAKLLIDHIIFPPVVPFPIYPIRFEAFHRVQNPDIVETHTTGSQSWVRPTYDWNSNVPYIGHSAQYGHAPGDAFDTNPATYWLSIGNGTPNQGYSFEYIQGRFAPGRLQAVKFQAWGGPYRYYISVMENGRWLGNQIVPYDANHPVSAPNGSNIPFVASGTVARDGAIEWRGDIGNASKVRICFTNLFNSGLGRYPYRAGCRSIEVLLGSVQTITTRKHGGYRIEGNFGDYSEIVKKLLAWGGFWWPKDPTDGRILQSTGNYQVQAAPADDAYLKAGRIWGDIEMSRTSGIEGNVLDVPIWDKKPLMDGITYIKDILGFNFFIDEIGGAVFRSPNIFSLGNYVSLTGIHTGETAQERLTRIGTEVFTRQRTFDSVRRSVDLIKYGNTWQHFEPLPVNPAQDEPFLVDLTKAMERVNAIFDNRGVPLATAKISNRTSEYVTIDERQTLIGLTATLSSRNVRERTFVANTTGKVGAVSAGWNPYPSGQRRVAQWTDQHFKSNREAQVMADMIALRQLFTYRTDAVTIPGYPAIQIDDQVQLLESTTEEGYMHYVKGISSDWDLETGKWTYELETHWLGERPFDKWVFNPYNLSAETQAFLGAIGKI